MKTLRVHIHPDAVDRDGKTVFQRHTTRAICLRGSEILLLYTQRYDDYSLPGGGIDEGEDHQAGLIRELTEETGAQNIRNIQAVGQYEEIRPWYKPDFDFVHMISYCYLCEVDKELQEPQLEKYEEQNGMKPVWISIENAIEHNEKTLAESPKKGLSLERELFLLRWIQSELIP